MGYWMEEGYRESCGKVVEKGKERKSREKNGKIKQMGKRENRKIQKMIKRGKTNRGENWKRGKRGKF